MKKITLYIMGGLLIFIYFTSTSCKREDYSKEIIMVDSLLSQANIYKANLDTIDSMAVMSLKPIIEQDVDWIKENLTKETMGLGSVFLVTVRAGSKLTSNFPSEYSSLKRELDYSIKQLEDLRTDLKKGSLDKTTAEKYFKDEAIAFNEIDRHCYKMFGRLESLKDYDDIREDFYEKLNQQ